MARSQGTVRGRRRDIVTSTLGKQILSGVFAPGARLPTESELGERLGVSRTALRESIRTLAGKGLIETKSRSGTIVLPSSQWNHLDPELLGWREELAPDFEFVRSLNEARSVIEPAGARLAAERATGHDLGRIQSSLDAMRKADARDIEASVKADEAFHLAVLAASHNPLLLNFGSMIGPALRNLFRLTTSASQNFAATLDMHWEVLEAIRMRRPEEAGERMAALLAIASRDLAEVIARRASQQ